MVIKFGKGKRSGARWVPSAGRAPRIVRNILSQDARYPSSSIFGTGARTLTTETLTGGVLNGLLQMDSLSAGRSFNSATVTLTAGQWYCFSFEITAFSGMTGATGVFAQGGGTAVINSGSVSLVATDIIAGGIGRYCLNFKSDAGGTFIWRLGVGLSGNVASHSLTVKNLMLENVASVTSVSEYVWPSYSAAFNYDSILSISANKEVIAGTPTYYTLTPYSNIIAIGDSRADEASDYPIQLATLLEAAGIGTCNAHAHSGWAFADAIAFTEGAYNLTYTDALDGTLSFRNFSTAGNARFMYNQGAAYNCLLIGNFGVNDVNGGVALNTTMANLDTIVRAAGARGMQVILSSNNPWSASVAWSAPEQTATEALNAAIASYASTNGYMYIDIYDALGDDADATKLSDGTSTSPNYSQDGLHPNSAGSLKTAELIRDAIIAAT